MLSVDLMSLWNPVCSVLLCYSVRNRTHPRYEMRRMWLAGEFFLSWKIFFFLTEGISFSHRTHWFNRTFLRTVLSPQNASGIQISQNVTAIFNTNKGQQAAYIQPIGVSRWSRPFPSGEGKGEGPSSFWTLCVLFFCVFLWEIEHTHSMSWRTNNSLGSFISHRAHRVHWAFLRTVSSPQNASGIQISQSVTAKGGCWVIVVRCWWLAIGVSR